MCVCVYVCMCVFVCVCVCVCVCVFIYIYIYMIIYIIQVKEAAAKTEEAWKEAGKAEGLQIWRIVDFNVSFLQFILSFYDQYS